MDYMKWTQLVHCHVVHTSVKEKASMCVFYDIFSINVDKKKWNRFEKLVQQFINNGVAVEMYDREFKMPEIQINAAQPESEVKDSLPELEQQPQQQEDVEPPPQQQEDVEPTPQQQEDVEPPSQSDEVESKSPKLSMALPPLPTMPAIPPTFASSAPPTSQQQKQQQSQAKQRVSAPTSTEEKKMHETISNIAPIDKESGNLCIKFIGDYGIISKYLAKYGDQIGIEGGQTIESRKEAKIMDVYEFCKLY